MSIWGRQNPLEKRSVIIGKCATPTASCATGVFVCAIFLLEACFGLLQDLPDLFRCHVAAALAFNARFNVGVHTYLGKA